MWDVMRRSPTAVAIAVGMHVAIILLMVFGLDWLRQPEPIKRNVPIVQARLVDSKKLQAEIKQLEIAENASAAAAEAKRKQELKQKREAEQRKLEELQKQRRQREKEAQAVAEKKQREAELKRKQAAEKKKRLQAEKKRKAEEARKKAEAEEKRKAEEARKKAEAEKKRKAEEARKQAAAEKQRKAEAARKQAEAERKAREAALAAEVQAEQDAGEMLQVVAAIQNKVERNWRRPAGTEGLKCTVNVRLGSSGSVLLVKVVRSSGNGAFDRSVENAVRKAEPLPMPSSPRLQAQFRDINFVFDPN